jgi:hypothetical protein
MSQKRHHAAHPPSSVKANLAINQKPNPRGGAVNNNPSLGTIQNPRDMDSPDVEPNGGDITVCDDDMDMDDRGRRRVPPRIIS